MKFLKEYWHFLNSSEKKFFVFMLFLSAFQTVIEMIGIAAIIPFATLLLNPEALKNTGSFYYLYENYNFPFKENPIIFFCIFFLLIFLFKNILVIIISKITLGFVYRLRTRLYLNLLKKVMHQNYLYFINKGTTKIFNITFNEVSNFTSNISTPLITLISEVLISIGIIILIILTGYLNGLALIIPIVVIAALILKKINVFIKSWSQMRIVSTEKILKGSFNLMGGIKEIFIFGNLKKILLYFEDSLNPLMKIDINNGVIATVPKALLEQLVIIVFIAIILTMNSMGSNNQDTMIVLGFFLAAAYRLVPSLNKIFISYQRIKFGKPSIQRIKEFYNLNYKKEHNDSIQSNSNDKLNFNNKIILKDINFSYIKNYQTLKNINLEIRKNNIIGFFGESGSGKSTLVDLITGLLKPSHGNILVDDKEINNLKDSRSYTNLFCLISQDTFLLEGNVRDNILFGSEDSPFNNERFFQAIKFSQLEKFVNDLPNGVDTYIGNNFKKISSGQKQRIAIARSFYSNREILIFDEATNALDESNEKTILKNLMYMKNKKTIILISHNFNNLDICDKIYFIENGSLVEKKIN